MASTVAPAARIIASTTTAATMRRRRAASRPPVPPIPITPATLPPEDDGSWRSAPPEQGVQRGAGGCLPADLLQPVDVQQRRHRGEPLDAVQDRRIRRPTDARGEVLDVVAEDEQPAAGAQPADRSEEQRVDLVLRQVQ